MFTKLKINRCLKQNNMKMNFVFKSFFNKNKTEIQTPTQTPTPTQTTVNRFYNIFRLQLEKL